MCEGAGAGVDVSVDVVESEDVPVYESGCECG